MRAAVPFSFLLAAAFTLRTAEAFALPQECPDVFPLGEVEAGMQAQGWTVAHGQTPEPFSVEVLGVLRDGIALGRDMIIVEISDEPGNDMIERAGGVWAGMSGSPVYVGERLLGAVSYSFGLGPTPVGGVTPAENMLEVLSIGEESSNSPPDARVEVPQSLRPLLAQRAGLTENDVASLEPLPISFAVSGLTRQRRELVQGALDRAGISAVVTLTSSATRQQGPISARPVPGGNFAGLLALGDLTAGGVGTTTYVCGDRALAFGHSLRLLGSTQMIAGDAEAITVVPDPTIRPFKLANFGSMFGVLDQDRTVAIAATLGKLPPLVRIRSVVKAPELGRKRTGVSWTSSTRLVPDVSALHLLSNLEAIFDEVGDGRARAQWRVRGRRANGDDWFFGRSNRYASKFDIAAAPFGEVLTQLATIENNPFEDVTFRRVKLRAKAWSDVRIYRIESFTILKGGEPLPDTTDAKIGAGEEIVLEVILRSEDGTPVTADLALRVPANVAGNAVISVFGSAPGGVDTCLFSHADCPGGSGDSFQDLLDHLADVPQNNDLSASLKLVSGVDAGRSVGASRRFSRVVDGSVQAFVDVVPVASASNASTLR